LKPLRALTSVALVVAAAGASAYAYLIDRGTISDADRTQRQRDLFPSFRVEDVTRIELEQAGERLVLQRNPDDRSIWLMTSPHPEAADASAVDVLLRELEMAKRLREAPARSEDAPRAATRVRGRIVIARLRYDFELEDDAPRPEGAAYMRIEGEGTFVIDRTLKVQLLRSADAYRQRTLVPYGASEVARLNVGMRDGGYTLQRKGSSFRVPEAGSLRASREAVEQIFGALADARVDVFLDRNEIDAAAAFESALSVDFIRTDTKRTRVRLSFGSSCPGRPEDLVVTRDGASHVTACIPRMVEGRLASKPDTLVDRSLFFAHADEIEQLRLESLGSDGARVDLARRGSSWRARAPDERDLTPDESDSVSALVADLARAQALDARPGGTALGPARVRATIVRTGSSTTEVVEVGPTGHNGIAYARRLDDDALLRLPRDVARRLYPHPIATHGRAIGYAPFDASDVTAIDDSCGPTPQRLDLRDGRWAMNVPAGFSVDPQAAADIADAMAHAKADAWISETDDGAFGFETPTACTVAVTLSSRPGLTGPRQVGIIFGDEHAGGFYAKTLEGPGVFIAPAALRVLASHPAIDRARLRLDTAPLTRVTLVHDGERRVIDMGARATEPAGGPRDAGRAEELGRAVVSLYAHDALHSGAPPRSEGFDRPTLQIDAIVRADAGSVERIITIGAATQVGPFDAYFARLAGVDATFAVPRRSVERILDAW